MNNRLTGTQTGLLLGAFAAGTALHAASIPPWCLAAPAIALLWRWAAQRGLLPLPGRALRVLLTLALTGAVLLAFRTLGGIEAGSALLVGMGAAKLLETRAPRDALVVAVVALVLVLAAVLDRQALAWVPAYLVTGWLALATIAALGSHAAARAARPAFTAAGKALLLAAPLAAVCFVLVPRLPGALWSAPPSPRALSGLSDEMSPGSITELALSDELAFRVRFEDAPPPPAARYWRGPVLHDFDGATWRRLRGQLAKPQETIGTSPPLRYEVMLEPNERNYLFALDTVATIEGQPFYRLFDGQVVTPRAVTAPLVYTAVSHLATRPVEPLSRIGRRIDTQLPPARNPRSLALARELRAAAGSDEDYAQRVLDYLRTGGFEYSLTPPPLGTEPVDDFLFGTRLGFCGHYASAYVTLMRAAGVPARVVTGYLGGSWNPVGGFYTVRQAEAHAWTEIWLAEKGWTRIDPTAVVAPGRLDQGLFDLLPESRSAASAWLGRVDWLRDLRYAWDAAGLWWLERVVNFNRAAQLSLLAKLGLDRIDYRGMALLLAAGIVLWVLPLLLMWRRAPRPPRRDALGRLWEGYAALLARRGVAVGAHEGPEAVRQRARAALPEAATDIDLLARDYARLRFGPGTARPDERTLRALRARLSAIARATRARRRPRTAPAAQG
jgi:transglutaminase-like putative cysteine protease